MKTASSIIGLGVLAMSLSACGVRQEESAADGTTAAASGTSDTSSTQTSGGTSLPVTTGSTSNPTTGAAIGEEGSGNFVELNFTDAYTGYWENETRSSNLSTEIVRLTYGELYYHIEVFNDQSSGSGSTGLNCYIRNGLSLTNYNIWGLRGAADVDKTTDYREWTLDGSKLHSSIYDDTGEIMRNSSGTATYKKVFTGLSAADLQICTN